MQLPRSLAGRIPEAIEAARLPRGLSQREVAAIAGETQSRLAGIEPGKIDFRAAMLVQIARALGLELFLIPRQALPAVESLVRTTADVAGRRRAKIRRSLQRIRQRLLMFQSGKLPASVRARAEYAWSLADSASRYLEWLRDSDLRVLLRIERFLKHAGASDDTEAILVRAGSQLRPLEQMAVRESSRVRQPSVGLQRGAYSLDFEDEGR